MQAELVSRSQTLSAERAWPRESGYARLSIAAGSIRGLSSLYSVALCLNRTGEVFALDHGATSLGSLSVRSETAINPAGGAAIISSGLV